MGSSKSKPESIIHYVEQDEAKGETKTFRSKEYSSTEPICDQLPGKVDTLLKLFEIQREKFGPRPLYGTRQVLPDGSRGKYLWKSYNEVFDMTTNLAKGCLINSLCNVVDHEGSPLSLLGIFFKTSEEWMMTWIASWYLSGCVVPLYDTLGEESIEWIVQQAELKTIVTTAVSAVRLEKMKKEGRLETLKAVITFETPTKEDTERAAEAGLRVFGFHELIESGRKSGVVLKPKIAPDTLAMICYTSGTTSKPKGVMLSHRNYVSLAHGIKSLSFMSSKADDSCLCWLPLAHVFEQFATMVMLALNVKLGFYSGDMMKLTQDMQVLKPQFFGSVPRVFNRIYEQTMRETAKLKGFKKYLFNKATAAKLERLRTTGNYKHSLYDFLVFKKIRSLMGGCISLIFLGGAPVSSDVLEMVRIWLSCKIVQGYGQTETAGPICAQTPWDNLAGSIGAPLPHAEMKIIDVPDMKYLSSDIIDGVPTPRGEIMVRGPSVSPGYWRDPVMTRETFTEDGWVHTGDIGSLSPLGHMIIIDRKKHLFKLAQGEYIAPEKLENIYQRCKYVSQVFITGDSYKTYLIAVVVPNQEAVLALLKSSEWHGKGAESDFEASCRLPELKLVILRELEVVGKQAKCNSLEIIKNIVVCPTPFSVENDTMTPTQKIKRYQAKKLYEEELQRVYEEPLPDFFRK